MKLFIFGKEEIRNFSKITFKWNFKYYKKIINSQKFKNVNRYNPDGLSLNWCFYDNMTDTEYFFYHRTKKMLKIYHMLIILELKLKS